MLERITDPRHASYFEYVRPENAAGVPPPDPRAIDVAILDMNHSWPNLGHNSLVHAVLEAAEAERGLLQDAMLKVRVVSFDVRRLLLIPQNGRFRFFIGTGGPGHLDPRQNDGINEFSQGIAEDPSWEAPLFQLFDDVLGDPHSALLAVCHSFGLVCRWSGIAHPVLRGADKGGKSSGMPTNVLSDGGLEHPWFARFADHLEDHRHFRVVDNRLFDLVADPEAMLTSGADPISFELSVAGDDVHDALTMVELARDYAAGMPRVFGVNHHPEIIDREHCTTVLEEKFANGEVTRSWYEERINTLRDDFAGERERQSQLTSWYTLIGPLRYHVSRLIHERCEELGIESETEDAVAAG
jgi:hypothetical protein